MKFHENSFKMKFHEISFFHKMKFHFASLRATGTKMIRQAEEEDEVQKQSRKTEKKQGGVKNRKGGSRIPRSKKMITRKNSYVL